MTLYRIGHKQFINDLEGTGARLFGGRWNPEGMPCIYTSIHLSLALLEKFVHAQTPGDMTNQAVITFAVPDSVPLYTVDMARLKPDWKTNAAYTGWLGSQILSSLKYAGFIVPSAIVPSEQNIVLNPRSPHFPQILPSEAIDFEIDKRLRI